MAIGRFITNRFWP